MAGYRPTIFVYLCSWCPSVGLSEPEMGELHRRIDAHVEMVRLPCSAAIDPTDVARSFCGGADGVLWVTCPEGNCHYYTGNWTARSRFLLFRKLLASLGHRPQRLRLETIAHDERRHFAQALSEFREQLSALGPYADDNRSR